MREFKWKNLLHNMPTNKSTNALFKQKVKLMWTPKARIKHGN